jgi:hypothetical protein
MIFAVCTLPLDVTWTVLEANGLVLARRLGFCELQVLLDDALRLRVVDETCGRCTDLSTVLAISKKLSLKGLDIRTLSR